MSSTSLSNLYILFDFYKKKKNELCVLIAYSTDEKTDARKETHPRLYSY